MEDVFWSSNRINAWVKDSQGHYIKCSEGFAMHAGLDSPTSIIGKRDDQLIWKDDFIRINREDRLVISGLSVSNAHHIMPTHKGLKTILVNKYAEKRHLVGHAIDITGQVLMEQKGRWNLKTGMFEINGIELTQKEIEVVRLILLGQSTKLIAAHLGMHEKTIEQRQESLRRKFNCASKVVLVQTLHKSGLSYLAMNKDKKFMI